MPHPVRAPRSKRQNPEPTEVQQPLLRLVLLAAFSVNVLKPPVTDASLAHYFA